AVKVNPQTGQAIYEPANRYAKHITTALLALTSVWAVRQRRIMLERVNGLVSLAGASRPMLTTLAWTAGILACLNARPPFKDLETSANAGNNSSINNNRDDPTSHAS
ncbi:hypothetical protein EV182_006463, partial [Spiromyces aspiralis]